MLKICVCVSGGGTNLQAIIDAIANGTITNTQIVGVISNNKNAYALERAKEHGIPAVCVSPKDYESREIFNDARYLVGRLNENEYVIVDVLIRTKRFVVTTKKLYNYLQRKESITKKNSDKNIIDALDGFYINSMFYRSIFQKKNNQNIQLYLSNLKGIYLAYRRITKLLKRKIIKEYNL